MNQQSRSKKPKKWVCAPCLLLAMGIIFAATSTAYGQTIPATLNGGATYTNSSSSGDVTAARTTVGTSPASPSFTVNFNGATAGIKGNLTIGAIVQNWNNGSGGSGTVHGNVTLNFGATQSTITGSVSDTSASNSASSLNVASGALTVGGSVADTGNNLNVNLSNDATLMIDGNLGANAIMNNSTSAILGVQGNINATQSFTMTGGTLMVGSATTGMSNVTMTSAGGAATITSYSTGDLNFSNANRPNMTVGADTFAIENYYGNITFSDYTFGAAGTGFSITGGGSLEMVVVGAGKNLNFNEGVDLNTETHNNKVTLISQSGNVNVASGKDFTYTGGTNDLAVKANNVSFGGATAIIQSNNGATSIFAEEGVITHTGAYSYTGVDGNLTETAIRDLTFGADATIGFTGAGATTLTAGQGGASGSFTATGAFSYTSTSTTTVPATGNLIIKAHENVLFNSTSSITQAGDDATTISANTGSITHTGNFTYTGVDGNLDEDAARDLTFSADATIGFTGAGAATITTRGGNITFGTDAGNSFNYTGLNGDLTINAGASGTVTFNAAGDIDFSDGTGSATITGNKIVLGGMSITGGTLTLNSADNRATSLSVGVDGKLTAANLRTDSLALTDASAAADIGIYDVTTADSTITLTDTTAANVVIDTINLGGGKTLEVTGAGAYSFTTLNVLGVNAGYTGTMNAASKTLNFDLTGAANGNTMLTTSSAGDVTGATVNLFNIPSSLELGNRVTLVSQTTGTAATTQISTSAGDVNYGFSIGGTSSLSLFMNSVQTDTDYVVTGPKTYAAGTGPNESVTFDVGGKLTVNGGLTMESSASNAATLKAGTLDADSLTLNKAAGAVNVAVGIVDATAHNVSITLNGTAAGNGTTGVKFDTVNLTGGNTFAVTSQNSGLATIDALNVTGTGGTVNTVASQTIGTVNLAGGATLTDSGSLSFNTMNVQGVGATYDGNLAAGSSASLNFDVTNVDAGETMLNVTGTVNLANISITLKAQNPLTLLGVNDEFDLISSSGVLTDADYNGARISDSLQNTYLLSADANTLSAKLLDPRTFREIIDDEFGGSGRNNENLESGADYLDDLAEWAKAGLIDPDRANAIGNAFNDAIAAGGIGSAVSARSVQQFSGAYSAYANQALSDDMSRFRRRWQGQNRHFLDARLFANEPACPGTIDPCAVDSGSRVWAGGFGTWAKQDNRNNLPGYKYDSRGVVLGYEYSVGNLNLGFAAAYSRGDLKVNDLRYKNEADVLNLALYGAYISESGFYAEGGFGYGHAWNDYKVDYIAVPGGVKKAKYGSDTFTADLELGYIARLPNGFNLIPSAGVEYSYLRNGGWTESVNNADLVANRFDSGHGHGVDIPLGLRVNKMFRFGCDGGFVVPEVRASYVYSAKKSRASVVAGYAGVPGGAKMVGVDPGRGHWRIGAGLSGRVNSRVDFRVDYDFETRSGYKGHNLSASVGISF